MKSIDIHFIDTIVDIELSYMHDYFEDLPKYEIGEINWKKFSYLPEAKFRIFYSNISIFIKYDVLEQSVLAQKLNVNDPVHKDSCVEFFVSPGDGKYYNFEFNCIGTKYLGSGADRSSGKTMHKETTSKIKTMSSLGHRGFDEIKKDTRWSLIVEIPFEIFTDKNIDEIKGSSMEANFYKCGDQMLVPHYVTWNKINTEEPDFHRPECFGQINFK
ncbi:MAG: carbohydrate-binding family 9-like protein [Spirochaetaceae bacterium]